MIARTKISGGCEIFVLAIMAAVFNPLALAHRVSDITDMVRVLLRTGPLRQQPAVELLFFIA
jgi:hypothetical protein